MCYEWNQHIGFYVFRPFILSLNLISFVDKKRFCLCFSHSYSYLHRQSDSLLLFLVYLPIDTRFYTLLRNFRMNEWMNELSIINWASKRVSISFKLYNLKTCRFYTQNWIYVLNKLTQISLFRIKVQRRHCQHDHLRRCCSCHRRRQPNLIYIKIVTF